MRSIEPNTQRVILCRDHISSSSILSSTFSLISLCARSLDLLGQASDAKEDTNDRLIHPIRQTRQNPSLGRHSPCIKPVGCAADQPAQISLTLQRSGHQLLRILLRRHRRRSLTECQSSLEKVIY